MRNDQQRNNGFVHSSRHYNQSGAGFMDWLTKAVNLIPSSDPTARDLYPGERHAPLFLEKGSNKMGFANWCGPGTNVLKRVRRGDGPRANLETDKVAMGHDLRYELNSRLPKKEQIKANREADKILVNKLKNSKKGDPRNKKIVRNLISAKMFMEDHNINKSFQTSNTRKSHPDDIHLEKKLKQIAQEGYGAGFPGMKLKNQVIKQHKKHRRHRQKGTGIADAIANKAFPYILDKLGVPNNIFKKKDIKTIVNKAISYGKNKPLKYVVKNALFPILDSVLKTPKSEQKDLQKQLYKGIVSFLKQSGNGMKKSCKCFTPFLKSIHQNGEGLIDFARDAIKKGEEKAYDMLPPYLRPVVKFITEADRKQNKMILDGLERVKNK